MNCLPYWSAVADGARCILTCARGSNQIDLQESEPHPALTLIAGGLRGTLGLAAQRVR